MYDGKISPLKPSQKMIPGARVKRNNTKLTIKEPYLPLYCRIEEIAKSIANNKTKGNKPIDLSATKVLIK